MPAIVYLTHLPTPRIGGASDENQIQGFLREGMMVFAVDYTNDPTPTLLPRICSATIPSNQYAVTITVTLSSVVATACVQTVIAAITPYGPQPLSVLGSVHPASPGHRAFNLPGRSIT
jgi:hypothetical protein